MLERRRPELGVFVGERQNWTFFKELYEDLRSHYAVRVFKPRHYNTPLLHGRLNRWSYHHKIRSILKACDVAFFEWASEVLEAATHMPKYCPTVVRLHSFEVYTWADRIQWGGVDQIIFVSEALRATFLEKRPELASRTTVVPNAVRLDLFKPTARERGLSIGMLGAFNPVKRIYEVILALSKLRSQGLPATLHLAGARLHDPGMDQYYVACRRLVEKLRLEDSVVFYGHVDATAQWLQGIDVFISNSYWEGQQVALLEALASGCYCLSHCWRGADEILPADNIFITAEELIEKITAYAILSEREKAMGHLAMRSIAEEKCDVELQKTRVRGVIDKVLAVKDGSSRKRVAWNET